MTRTPFELRIPPVVLVLLFGLGTWMLAQAFPREPLLAGYARNVASAALAVAGLLAAWLGVREFRRARTTVNPLRPDEASAMVRSGVYRCTRNPMYLGMLLLLGAWSLWLGNVFGLALLPLFVLAMNVLQIVPEERALAQRFPEEFAEYRRRVRRWL
jgi:protein-S-isoprenylcysteine O-methyltransferase Ste14